jgi:Tfp pilus assembly protein PilZ
MGKNDPTRRGHRQGGRESGYMTPNTRRKTQPRYPVTLPVELTYEGFRFDATCLDLSVGGMFVKTNANLSENSVLRLRFHLPRIEETIEVHGKVRWHSSRGLRPGAGIQFFSPKSPRGLKAKHIWALNTFFSERTPKN